MNNKIVLAGLVAALAISEPANGRLVMEYDGKRAILPGNPADAPKKSWETRVEPASANNEGPAYQTLFNYVVENGECALDSCSIAGKIRGSHVYMSASQSEGHPILVVGSVQDGQYDVTAKVGNHDGQIDALANGHYISGKVTEWSCTEAGKWPKTLDLVVNGLTQVARDDPLSPSFKEPSNLKPGNRFALTLALNLGDLDQINLHSVISAPICPQSSNLYKQP